MKKLFFITTIIIVCITSTYSQSNYYKGFYNGFKEGYCHDQGELCVEPNPPNAPNPRIDEDLNSYMDGYNRGFKMGQKAQSQGENTTKNRKRYKTSSPKFQDHTYKPDFNLSLILANQKIEYNRLKNRVFVVMIEKNDMLLKEKRYDELFAINDKAITFSKEQSINKIAEIAYFYKSLAYLDKYHETGDDYNLGKAYDNAVKAKKYGANIKKLMEEINKAKKFEREK